MKQYKVGLVGIGAVGTEMIKVLRQRQFPASEIRVLATRERDEVIAGETFHVLETKPESFEGLDIVLFAGTEGSKGASKMWGKVATEKGAFVIDNGDDFRMHDDVPLVIPEINADDMEAMIRKAKDALYTFTSTVELRTTMVTETTIDEETGQATVTEKEITEKWKIYTIVYNGEAYLEDKIFALSDEQKKLAENYAQNLSVFLGDGMMQGLLPAESADLVSLGDIRFTDGATQVIYYNQLDKRYAGKPYGTDDIGTYGCGPTCMAMVVSSLTNDTVDPVEMARWAYENGYWCSKSGSYHSLIPGAAKAWGLPVQGCGKTDGQRIVDALSQGKLVVAIMLKGHFTSSGHFIVLRGVENGKILVADPASYTRSQQTWDLSIILNEASSRAGAGGPFWIIG